MAPRRSRIQREGKNSAAPSASGCFVWAPAARPADRPPEQTRRTCTTPRADRSPGTASPLVGCGQLLADPVEARRGIAGNLRDRVADQGEGRHRLHEAHSAPTWAHLLDDHVAGQEHSHPGLGVERTVGKRWVAGAQDGVGAEVGAQLRLEGRGNVDLGQHPKALLAEEVAHSLLYGAELHGYLDDELVVRRAGRSHVAISSRTVREAGHDPAATTKLPSIPSWAWPGTGQRYW